MSPNSRHATGKPTHHTTATSQGARLAALVSGPTIATATAAV